MEDALQARVAQIRDRLQDILRDCTITGVGQEDLTKTRALLAITMERLKNETLNYMQASALVSKELVDSCTSVELEADSVLVNLDMLLLNKTEQQKSLSSTKLPKLDLPTFSGDITQFHSFWDRFSSSVDNQPLTEADKMSYLMTALKGTARSSLEGLEISQDNYKIALKLLRERYGRMDLLLDAHYKALQMVKKCTYEYEECRKTLDTIEINLRVLQSLGEDINQNHLRVTILSKFPEPVIYELKLMQGRDMGVGSIRKSLNKIVIAMEGGNKRFPDLGITQPQEPSTSATTEALHIRTKPGNGPMTRKRKQLALLNPYSTQGKRQRKTCIFCQGNHFNDECEKVQDMDSRMKLLSGRCFRCLLKGHLSRECDYKKDCFHCKENHNRALCPTKMANKGKSYYQALTYDVWEKTKTLSSLLQTATIRTHHGNKSAPCRLLLDSGSQRSYITQRKAKEIDLHSNEMDHLMVYTFGSNNPIAISSPSAEVTIETRRGTKRTIRVNVVPSIADNVPVPTIELPEGCDTIADDGSAGETIDLLIGNDLYFSFLSPRSVRCQDQLYLVDSEFGWIVSGQMKGEKREDLSVVTYCQCHVPGCLYLSQPDIPLRNMDLSFLWAMDSIGITDSHRTTREDEAINHFNSNVTYKDNRYQVKWPWINYPPDLLTNFGLAYGRLKALLSRSNEDTLLDYNIILKEQLASNIIEVIEPEKDFSRQTNPPIHYLPHHMVKQDNKRGRIVYDASAKVREEKSLNECLYRGPLMLGDLTALLLKFRVNRVGITADVEKAFLQLGLQEEDRDVTRFLWIKDPTKPLSHENLLHLRFCRVPFGVVSSPFLLTATLRYHMTQTNKELLKRLADNCYVDNLVTGTTSCREARELYKESRTVFNKLAMNIREWNSNNAEFLNSIPEAHRSKDKIKTKLLGLIWDLSKDTLRLNIKDTLLDPESIKNTKNKRQILSKVASIYDPCGFISPLVLPAKTLLQQICDLKLKWDANLPEEIKNKWEVVAQNLKAANNVEIPRFIGLATENTITRYDIHGFSDASKEGYATVVYLRAYTDDEIKVTLLMSKSRVTTSEEKANLNMPRLELLGCLIGSRLINYVNSVISIPVSKFYLWTDSLIALSWMKSNKLLPPFVARRINEIKRNRDLNTYYVNTEDNPADVATRPHLWQTKNHLWFHGPQFLSQVEEKWPSSRNLATQEIMCLAGEGLHQEGTDCVRETTLDRVLEEDVTMSTPTNESSIEVVKDKTINDLKKIQEEAFPEEYCGKETNLSRNLGLYLDVDGLIRCRGRLANANWTYDRKHPILVPTCGKYTEKLVTETHEKNYHVGVNQTLSAIRETFWIPKGRAQVKKILNKCPQCIKHGGGPYKLPPTPALPPERVNYSAPFTYTGIDYFGPVYVNASNEKDKRWICLYTCLAVRAIHMEIVKDMTAEECLLALRRFISARGVPNMIVSDNALQFKLTSEILSTPYCNEQHIKWKFIPQLAPWHGGFYERMVGLVKHCMKRTLEKQLLDDTQLLTVVKEIEAVVNTRPLTAVGSEVEHILKPKDFLSIGNQLSIEISDATYCPGDTVVKQRLIEGWKRGQTVLKEFQRMFSDQYLSNLRERYQNDPKQPHTKTNQTPCVGDIVQIKGDSKNRENWKVGKISALIKGADGEVRVARIIVGKSEMTRSIGQLYPLEITECGNETITPRTLHKEPRTESSGTQPILLPYNERLIPMQLPCVNNNSDVDIESLRDYPVDNDDSIKDRLEALPTEGAVEQEYASHDSTVQDRAEFPAEETKTCEKPLNGQEEKWKRVAAIRAREKIAEWTRHLLIALQ